MLKEIGNSNKIRMNSVKHWHTPLFKSNNSFMKHSRLNFTMLLYLALYRVFLFKLTAVNVN